MVPSVYMFSIANACREGATPIEIVANHPNGKNFVGPREQRKIHVEDFLPVEETHHTELGKCIHTWGYAEFRLHEMLGLLSNTDHTTALTIVASMGVKQVVDAINNLATYKLEEDNIIRVRNLLERVSSLATKRNIVVHGMWYYEIFIYERHNIIHKRSRFIRKITPPDFREIGRMYNPRNQKLRARYSLTEKQIIDLTRNIVHLAKDIENLSTIIQIYLVSKAGD